MRVSNISFQETGSFSKMILDYISGNDALKDFYQYAFNDDVIPEIGLDQFGRDLARFEGEKCFGQYDQRAICCCKYNKESS